MPFQIDGADVKAPISQTYEPRFSPFNDVNGNIVVSAYRACVCDFNALLLSEWAAWVAADDGAAHSVKIYEPNTNTLTTYTNVFIRTLNMGFSVGIYTYGVSLRITHISTAGLPAFGA